MSAFEKSSRMKLRFETDRGVISTEDLWDLTLPQLNKLAKALNREIKNSEEDDFLKETTSEDTVTKLRFDIVIHILETKKEEKKARAEASSKREEKQRLMGILERKQHEEDEALTPEQLLEKINSL